MLTLKRIWQVVLVVVFVTTLNECLANTVSLNTASKPETKQPAEKVFSIDEEIAFYIEKVKIEKELVNELGSLVKKSKISLAKQDKRLSKEDKKFVSEQITSAFANIEIIRMCQKKDEARIKHLLFIKEAERQIKKQGERINELLKQLEKDIKLTIEPLPPVTPKQ